MHWILTISPLRACGEGATEKRTGEPSKPALGGIGSSPNSWEERGQSGEGGVETCLPLASQQEGELPHQPLTGHRTSQVLERPCMVNRASSFCRWRNRHRRGQGHTLNYRAIPGHQAADPWAVVWAVGELQLKGAGGLTVWTVQVAELERPWSLGSFVPRLPRGCWGSTDKTKGLDLEQRFL